MQEKGLVNVTAVSRPQTALYSNVGPNTRCAIPLALLAILSRKMAPSFLGVCSSIPLEVEPNVVNKAAPVINYYYYPEQLSMRIWYATVLSVCTLTPAYL